MREASGGSEEDVNRACMSEMCKGTKKQQIKANTGISTKPSIIFRFVYAVIKELNMHISLKKGTKICAK